MAPSPATTPTPAETRARPEWVWRDASSEGVVGTPGSPPADNKR